MPSLRLTLGEANAESCVVGMEALKSFLWWLVEFAKLSKAVESGPPPERNEPSIFSDLPALMLDCSSFCGASSTPTRALDRSNARP
jgi:hypothetical protein